MTVDPITDNHALVIGASGGIGAAFCAAFTSRKFSVTALSRRDDGIDFEHPDSIERAAKTLTGRNLSFSHIIIATGALDIVCEDGLVIGPEKSFRDLDHAVASRLYTVNALGPALAFKHFSPFMRPTGRAVFAALSARVGSIGDNRLGGWMSYRASKAALNQFIRCASIEHQRTRPNHLVIALHPGTIQTPLTKKYAKNRYTDEPGDAASRMISVMEKLTPSDSGGFYAYDGHAIEW